MLSCVGYLIFWILIIFGASECTVIPLHHDWPHQPSQSLSNINNVRIKRDALPSERICKDDGTVSGIQSNTTDRLRRLRLLLKEENFDAYIVPSTDEHQSEYVSEHDKRREYISGFTGSAGTAVITLNEAALWTDGRYYLQAQQELDCNWILMKGSHQAPSIPEWLTAKLNKQSRVGLDSRLISQDLWLQWDQELKSGGKNIELVGMERSLIDNIWKSADGRPPESKEPIFVHGIEFAGKKWEDKINDVRDQLKMMHLYGIVISALDEIAWLFNLRGNDVPYTPVFKSYAFVSVDLVRFYVDAAKVTREVEEHLHAVGCTESVICVEIMDYNDFYRDVKNIAESNKGSILVPNKASYAVSNLVPKFVRVVAESPIIMLKAMKNPTEIERMKDAYLRDAVALIDFIAMLEKEVTEGIYWDEMKAAASLREYRKKEKLNMGESFETISASGPNGAVVHYRPQPSTNRAIDTNSMYLLDSGGQYLDGTIDITRTFHFGVPSAFEKEIYTRVLMGFIDAVSLVFPEGTEDVDIDILARRHLYESGLDYSHGTGHGIGLFLGVHEAPTHINLRSKGSLGHPLEKGMFTSIEPGYYQEGEFGVRLETVVVVTEASTKHHYPGLGFLKFEPVSLVPFEPKLIVEELLSDHQKKWLNDFNAKVRNIVGQELHRRNEEQGLSWLIERTGYHYSSQCASEAQPLRYNFPVLLGCVELAISIMILLL